MNSKFLEFLTEEDAETLAFLISDYQEIFDADEIIEVKTLGMDQQTMYEDGLLHFLLENVR